MAVSAEKQKAGEELAQRVRAEHLAAPNDRSPEAVARRRNLQEACDECGISYHAAKMTGEPVWI